MLHAEYTPTRQGRRRLPCRAACMGCILLYHYYLCCFVTQLVASPEGAGLAEARGAAAGSMNQQDLAMVARRRLSFLGYQVGSWATDTCFRCALMGASGGCCKSWDDLLLC